MCSAADKPVWTYEVPILGLECGCQRAFVGKYEILVVICNTGRISRSLAVEIFDICFWLGGRCSADWVNRASSKMAN